MLAMTAPRTSTPTWRTRLTRTATKLAATWFLFSVLLTPDGVTVDWASYLATYGAMLAFALVGLAGSMLCRAKKEESRVSHGIICASFIAGFFVVTLGPVYRLRW